MERTIGLMGQEIQQPSNPYHNLSERGLVQAQLNALEVMVPNLMNDRQATPQGSCDLGDGYSLLCARKRTGCQHSGIAGKVITNYIVDAELKLGNVASSHWNANIVRWARLRLPTGQIAW
jgi:hypothetical protein